MSKSLESVKGSAARQDLRLFAEPRKQPQVLPGIPAPPRARGGDRHHQRLWQ